jgi:hypothetical protein
MSHPLNNILRDRDASATSNIATLSPSRLAPAVSPTKHVKKKSAEEIQAERVLAMSASVRSRNAPKATNESSPRTAPMKQSASSATTRHGRGREGGDDGGSGSGVGRTLAGGRSRRRAVTSEELTPAQAAQLCYSVEAANDPKQQGYTPARKCCGRHWGVCIVSVCNVHLL